MAVAAATAIGLAAAGIGAIMWPPTPTAQQVFTATDVRTVTGAIPTGGTATVVYSRQKNTAVIDVIGNDERPRSKL
ncbi:anti-sigma factor, partial [Mycobacteroides abscessus subsp. massiliense]